MQKGGDIQMKFKRILTLSILGLAAFVFLWGAIAQSVVFFENFTKSSAAIADKNGKILYTVSISNVTIPEGQEDMYTLDGSYLKESVTGLENAKRLAKRYANEAKVAKIAMDKAEATMKEKEAEMNAADDASKPAKEAAYKAAVYAYETIQKTYETAKGNQAKTEAENSILISGRMRSAAVGFISNYGMFIAYLLIAAAILAARTDFEGGLFCCCKKDEAKK
jgi:hypothetical protein